MNRSSFQLLHKLLNTWQSKAEHSRRVSLPINEIRAPLYFAATLPDDKEALHAGLREAESAGVIKLEWGRGYEQHILKKIILVDGVRLAHYLGVPLAANQTVDARNILERELSGQEAWITEWMEELLDKWGRNQMCAGLSVENLEQARLLVRALEAVAAGKQRNLDIRTFSVRELGTSKVMENMLSRFITIWRKYHAETEELSADELKEALGLVKFPHPLLIRGPIRIQLVNRVIDCTNIRPFLGLPPQSIKDVQKSSMPEFVLTIENYASFSRYASEVLDKGLIIYTAGFPAPGVVDFLRLLDLTYPNDVPFYHWGDIDEGGLKILLYIQSVLSRTLKPHQMTPDLLNAFGQPNDKLRTDELKRIADASTETMQIVKAMVSSAPPKTLEQENVEPESPCSQKPFQLDSSLNQHAGAICKGSSDES